VLRIAKMRKKSARFFVALACGLWMVAHAVLAGADEAPPKEPEARLGPGDELTVWVRDAEEINDRKYRIEENGEVRFPLIGRISAAGATVKELEARLVERLKPVILEPDVHISLTDLRSHPVSISGAVHQSGIQQLRDRTTLMQALSAAGGPRVDAGATVRITRRKEYGPILLPSAREDPQGEISLADADLASILDGSGPAARLEIRPHDTITVARAEMIYVMGEVKRAGGFVLGAKEKEISVLQALAMAEGVTATATPKKAMILRPMPGEKRQGIPVDLKRVLAGNSEDLRLKPNDILFVPDNRSTAKRVAVQAAQTVAAVAVGVSVWRLGR
jgi:polysaccharide biosynthesis/export protein